MHLDTKPSIPQRPNLARTNHPTRQEDQPLRKTSGTGRDKTGQNTTDQGRTGLDGREYLPRLLGALAR